MKASISLITLLILVTMSANTWARKNCAPGDRRCRAAAIKKSQRGKVPPRVNREQRRRDIRRESRRPGRRPSVVYGPNYRRHYHKPHSRRYHHRRRYYNRHDYFRTIPRSYVYHNNWIRYYVGSHYGNGYVLFNDYPYFVYNGYRHRYSYYDQCDYELVDRDYNDVVRSFYGQSCADAYNRCAQLRDDWNWSSHGYRYFCSETYY